MNGIQYLPEGYLTGTAANAAYLSDMAGLVRAAEDGAVVEATAVKCDANMNLTVPQLQESERQFASRSKSLRRGERKRLPCFHGATLRLNAAKNTFQSFVRETLLRQR